MPCSPGKLGGECCVIPLKAQLLAAPQDGSSEDEDGSDGEEDGSSDAEDGPCVVYAPNAPLPSIGSAGHGAGTCRRCCFFPKGRCMNGYNCEFCHFDHEKRKRKSKKKKKKKRKSHAPMAMKSSR